MRRLFDILGGGPAHTLPGMKRAPGLSLHRAVRSLRKMQAILMPTEATRAAFRPVHPGDWETYQLR